MPAEVRVDPVPTMQTSHGSDRIRLVWYTDPHSVWCWGFEPALRRIETLYADRVDIDVRMGGLFEDFTPMREYWTRMSGGRWRESVSAFMGAVASQHRMPMNAEAIAAGADDFISTWPACIAAKAAEPQGKEAAARYLRGLREAFLIEGRSIHRREVQLEVAAERGLDTAAFSRALEDGSAEAAFRADLAECRRESVQGFPTFVIHGTHSSVRIEGYQPWEAFEHVLGAVPSPPATPSSVISFVNRFARTATREVAAVFALPDDEAEIQLDELAATGAVVRRETGGGLFWESPAAARSYPSAGGALRPGVSRQVPQD